ncbi:phosphatidylinositol-specific phospholipase C [Streptomyces sp. NPDC088725]|uniref:phosphatidylinositol-specific phospholipase C n=1 Tax=Streptomyces sp. NPDC088725 TaxID=3365873 RepID=UPI003822EE27
MDIRTSAGPGSAPDAGAGRLGRRGFLAGALAVSATALVGAGAVPALAASPAAPPSTLAVSDWMGGLGDGTALNQLTIPGTHDSGATVGGLYVACQETGIAEQLNSGIRFLDVRCRAFENAFPIHHEAFYQNLNFDDVLGACRDFLQAHPSETVLMRVKQEYSTESDAEFRRIFDTYLDDKGWRSLFWLDSALPALGEARGRVVLLADNAGLPGVRYGDGNLFDIQDDYQALPDAKYPQIEDQFREASGQPGKVFINYVSTAAYLPPRWNSDNLNPRVHAFIDGSEASGWRGLGIVPLDFPTTRPGLVESLIAHNG